MPFTKGHKPYKAMLGKKHSPETIAKIKAARAKQIITDDQKKKTSETLKKIGHKPPSWKGKKHKPETIEKIRKSKLGKKHYNWKGGRMKHVDGYVYIYQPEHPESTNKGYVFEHRLIMEEHIGRYLKSGEVVHHIDNDFSNNKLENLILFPNHSAHMKFHWKLRKLDGPCD